MEYLHSTPWQVKARPIAKDRHEMLEQNCALFWLQEAGDHSSENTEDICKNVTRVEELQLYG